MLLWFWLCLGSAGTSSGQTAEGLLGLLPEERNLAGLRPDGPPQYVEGEGLFSLIDGGAEIFLKFGFEKAVFQTYRNQAGQFVVLEIYQMKGPSGAKKVYAHKVQAEEKEERVGDEGMRGDHYVIFRCGGLLVTVTGSDSSLQVLEIVLAVAREVESKITKAHR